MLTEFMLYFSLTLTVGFGALAFWYMDPEPMAGSDA